VLEWTIRAREAPHVVHMQDFEAWTQMGMCEAEEQLQMKNRCRREFIGAEVKVAY
jgi:hypothetical protein